MFINSVIKNEKGFNLIELLVVISVIAILSAAAVPAYNDFVGNARVREAANDILQNMRTIRTMAIRDNRPYVMTFAAGANTYTFGIDNNADGIPDDFRGTGAPQTVNLQDYGAFIAFGSTPASGPSSLDTCGTCTAFGGPVSFNGMTSQTFFPDGTMLNNGYVAVTHTQLLFTYLVRTFYTMGKIDLWSWDGAGAGIVTACSPLDSPKRSCTWTEVR